ncbi:MAG: type II toxin-antitoxin system HicB family antitoxin [Nostoc sp.]|jgi:predicted RNase H-like HicB family nuclease
MDTTVKWNNENQIRKFIMQYQVFVQSQSQQNFVASVVGMPNLTVEGRTEEEAILNVKSALETQLARGKFVTIEVNLEIQPNATTPQMRYAGIFANDPTFDDFMEKLAVIRKESNAATDE